MGEIMEVYLFIGGMILLMVAGMIFWWKFWQWRRRKWLNNLNKPERRRWQPFEEYRVSHGGYKKGFPTVFGALVLFIVLFIIMVVFLGSFRMMFLLLAVICIPVLIIMARFVFKTRNRDQIISFTLIFSFFLVYGLYGLDILHGLFSKYVEPKYIDLIYIDHLYIYTLYIKILFPKSQKFFKKLNP